MKPDFSSDTAVERHVGEYLFAFGELELQTTDEGRAEWSTIVKRLRDQWKQWSGSDDLHQIAFAEPD